MLARPRSGFTLIELLMALAVVAVLAAAAFPLSEMSARRVKEKELREALWQMREAIDAYKKAADAGKIVHPAATSGYPPDLRTLVEGAISKESGRKVYFLRRIPRDPFADDLAAPPQQTWAKRSYDSPPDEPREGADVFDVSSRSTKVGLNGVRYNEW